MISKDISLHLCLEREERKDSDRKGRDQGGKKTARKGKGGTGMEGRTNGDERGSREKGGVKRI